MKQSPRDRIRAELKAVGVGAIGLRTPEAKSLVDIIHPDEHIGGVVYGSYEGGLAWLVATNYRVLFLDHKPLYSTTDELTYDVVSGVKLIHSGMFSSVILHTRITDYSIGYTNEKTALTFINFIEKRGIDSSQRALSGTAQKDAPVEQPAVAKTEAFTDEGLAFLKSHDTGVLSTVDRTGNVQGSVIHYYVDTSNAVYILTKSGTSKSRNVFAHSQVALTIHEQGTMKTLQLQGEAHVETDDAMRNDVYARIAKPHAYNDGVAMPPSTRLHEGSFMVIKITPSRIDYHDYAKVQ